MDDAATRLAVAWQDFCHGLLKLGEDLQRPATPRNEVDQAEGYRFICRLLRQGLENGLEHARQPEVAFREKDQYVHVGFTSPDQDPLTCGIDPQREYRITGTRGTNAGLGILSMDPRTMQHVGWINHDQLDVEPDGTFEVAVSQREQPGNWLRLTEGTSLLVIRCNFNDRANETRAQFKIDEVGVREAVRQLASADAVIAGLRSTLASTSVMFGRMVEWAEELVERPNHIGDLESYRRSSGSPDHDFRFGYFELAEGQALEVRFTPPECDNWQFQIGNWWVENLDNYSDNQGWVNKHRARVDADGGVTILVSPDPVEAPNWVDTFGRRTGVMGLRIICGESSPPISTRIVSPATVVADVPSR